MTQIAQALFGHTFFDFFLRDLCKRYEGFVLPGGSKGLMPAQNHVVACKFHVASDSPHREADSAIPTYSVVF